MAYTRYPVPYKKNTEANNNEASFLQLGLYAFTRPALIYFRNHTPFRLEQAEQVEMYRLLERGHSIRMAHIGNRVTHAVDTPEDLEKVRVIL
jgi:3-deoxy-manno-octulosonate cytidylyltransferase (CMP-KDO synthetase)